MRFWTPLWLEMYHVISPHSWNQAKHLLQWRWGARKSQDVVQRPTYILPYNFKPRPRYPRNDPVTHCTGDGASPVDSMDGCQKFRYTWNHFLGCADCNDSLQWLKYPGHQIRNWWSYKTLKIIIGTKTVQLRSKKQDYRIQRLNGMLHF